MRHVIWDWNGTLADDLASVVECVSASLAAIGEGPIVADDYRSHYTRPVRLFYDRLLQRSVNDAEWLTIEETFHLHYREAAKRVPLAADAVTAIEAVAEAGGSQSILSMWWHDDLRVETSRHGLERYMVRIDGNTKDASENKERLLAIHLRAMGTNGAVMIGDAMDDARAAAAVGIPCVLYDGGSHHRTELESAGVPVASSLVEAAHIALAS